MEEKGRKKYEGFWAYSNGNMYLISNDNRLIGHFERVGNQIHREYIRQAKKKPQEVKR